MKKLVMVLLLLIVIGSVSANYEIGNQSSQLDLIYGPGENIRGWLNMSFDFEPLNSGFEDSLGNTVELFDLLKSDSRLFQGTDYSCNPSDCGISYEAFNGQETKAFSMNEGETRTIGFEFNGELSGITSVSFDIESTASDSCSNQLELNFLLNNEIKLGNNKSHFEVCNILRRDGCFDESLGDYSNYILSQGPSSKYCQRIRLSESPGFRLGAWMNLANDSGDITLGIYDSDDDYFDEELTSCEITDSSGEGEFYCETDFLVTDEKEYFVCIYSDKADETSEIRGYSTTNGCGFYDTGSGGSEVFAYDIFAIGKRFDSVGDLEIRDNLPGEISLASEFLEKIDNITGFTSNCSQGCVIPIEIKSGASQDITIKNVNIRYEIAGGGVTILRRVHDINISSASISTNGFKQIYIDEAGFTLPEQHGGFPYSIDFKSQEVASADITIQEVPEIYALSPTTTASKFPTTFRAFVTEIGNDTIESYTWDFNGEIFTTIEPRITHSFEEVGNFPLRISIEDSSGRTSSKNFNVNVGSFISVLNEKINKSKNDLKNVETQLEEFSEFEQQGIQQQININELRTELTEIETLYGQSRYEEAVELLLELDVPESISTGVSTTLVSFFPVRNNVNLDVVQNFQGGIYAPDKESAYIDSIINLHTSNLDTKVKYSKIIAVYEGGREETLLNVFDFNANQVTPVNYSLYIYLKELDNLDFKEGYGETTEIGYVQIPFDTSTKEISFTTTEEIDFLDLPIFISPAISNLVIHDINGEGEQGVRWALFIMLIFFLLLAGLIVYIVLQQWYKNRYEKYLFKNRNFLFNLVTYIQNSKKKGLKDAEIIKKLKKSGWNSEQITYVMKKYVGKRTGMLEIPIDKILGLFRRKKVIPPATGVGQLATPRAFKPIPQLKRPLPAKRFNGQSPIIPAKKPVIPKNLPQNKKRFFKNSQ